MDMEKKSTHRCNIAGGGVLMCDDKVKKNESKIPTYHTETDRRGVCAPSVHEEVDRRFIIRLII